MRIEGGLGGGAIQRFSHGVGLPLGSPPPVISSSPGMPVLHFGKLVGGDAFCFVTVLVKGQSFLVGY